ncbi:MAG: CRISPR-associated protein Cas4 [Bacteroides sp.]|nr:CRISPR-associated protein Cas4 [Eubacterium sp.]MCM1418935.1 CRISPR-associated protein Cas4 [Roseburia sp.]MCM1462121.1 CRISPR-associated protein Cas4 [Bacteroides sp.]
MSYSEDEYLMLSGIQHFVFCRRQWALIHIEQQWEENIRTADGKAMHRNVHDSGFNETRGDKIIARAMAVSSSELGISGECDVVEFEKHSDGITLFGKDGRYSVTPIEYKRGEPKEDNSDIMQLAAQAMCLEEMLCCDIPFGYLFYGEKRRRFKIEFTADLRSHTKAAIDEMHKMYRNRHTPKGKRSKVCNACSLKNVCLPMICAKRTASQYISETLEDK